MKQILTLSIGVKILAFDYYKKGRNCVQIYCMDCQTIINVGTASTAMAKTRKRSQDYQMPYLAQIISFQMSPHKQQ